MLKKIANLGIEGAAKYQTSDWQGVLQRDLAEQLNRSRNCKLEVFKDLKDRLLAGDQKIHSQTSPPPGSVDPLPPGRVSQITRFQLPGQPTLFHNGSNDDQYRKAKEILDSVTARHGMKVDRVEVIKWINLDRDKTKQLPEGLLSELSARGYRISSQLRRPSDMNPFDPRRDQFWTEVYDFQARNDALGQSIIGYWSVGSLGAGNYMLLWAWALLP
jgi:hypothetical protein